MSAERFPQAATTTLSPPLAARRFAFPISASKPADDQASPKKLGGLVLTRHLGESIMIGDDVLVEVVGLKSGTARLKIVAPRTVAVHRREVYDEIQANPLANRFHAAEPLENNRPSKPNGGLVLSRRFSESVMIGDSVEVTVVEVRSTTVKLKIVAPRSVSVHRREVYESIRANEA